MGSHVHLTMEFQLPEAADPSLVLAHPTKAERLKIWTLQYQQWGQALTLDQYVDREEYLTTVPLAKNDGLRHWVLTDGTLAPDKRLVLASCDTLCRRGFVRFAGRDVKNAAVEGVGNVFTNPAYRGRGYASRMMVLLRTELAACCQGQFAKCNGWARIGTDFSVLYSDIGPRYYADLGWTPFASVHLVFPSLHSMTGSPRQMGQGRVPVAVAINYHELAELCAADEKILLEKMAGSKSERHLGTLVAIAPDLDTMLWHVMREDFMTLRIFGKTPAVKGAVFGNPGARLWAVWTRTYYGRDKTTDQNKLHILRFVIEDESCTPEHMAEGVRSIIEMASMEANDWHLSAVEMWNPTELLQTLVARSGLNHRLVIRERDGIPSLLMLSTGISDCIEWMANERFGWY